VVDSQNRIYDRFADVLAAGEVEPNGVLLARPIFADDFVGPDGDGMTAGEPPDFALAPGSGAIDRGEIIPGINGRFVGDGPDLGARESGCPTPLYGPRPPGMEAVTNPVDCSPDDGGLDPGADGGPGDDDDSEKGGGCGCRAGGRAGGMVLVLLAGLVVALARRRLPPS
jgi:hypothetical protein